MTIDWTSPQDVLQRTVYGEARSYGLQGMSNIASVILNREAQPAWWGDDIVSVCLHPWQFSCWNEGDPNRLIIITATESDPAFATAVQVASDALAGKLIDITDGADHYYAWRSPQPEWAKGRKPLVLGPHNFYKLGPGA